MILQIWLLKKNIYYKWYERRSVIVDFLVLPTEGQNTEQWIEKINNLDISVNEEEGTDSDITNINSLPHIAMCSEFTCPEGQQLIDADTASTTEQGQIQKILAVGIIVEPGPLVLDLRHLMRTAQDPQMQLQMPIVSLKLNLIL